MEGPNWQPLYGPDPSVLLRVAEHFLRRRHFSDCRKYALQAQQSDPTLPGLPELFAVADVLHASESRINGTLPDYYAVLQLDRISHDSNSIRQRFNHLSSLLNPNNNKFPFADQAYDLIRDALCVLSNPLKKTEFDLLLSEHIGSENGVKLKNEFSFWTVCPYCYYLYEFPRVYVDCCLRCHNEKCGRGFHSVEIEKPPVEVLRGGKYDCAGFLPIGFQAGEGKWNPLAPNKNERENESNGDGLLEISDDSGGNFEDDGVNGGERVERDEMSGIGIAKTEAVQERVMKRKKKTVAKSMKKLTGTGSRVRKEKFVAPRSGEDSESNEHTSDDEGGGDGLLGEVDFYDGVDDIFVSVQDQDGN